MSHSREGHPTPEWLRDPMVWVLFLGWLVPTFMLFAVEFPPLQDYPNHLLRVHAIEQLDAVPTYSEHLAVDARFRPNLTMDVGLLLLSIALPLPVAGKVLVSLGILLGCVAVWLFMRRFSPHAASESAASESDGSLAPRLMAALIAVHLLAGWFYLKGFWNFTTASSLGLLYLIAVFPRDPETLGAKRWWLACLAAFAVVTTHGFVFLAISAIAGFSWLMRERGPSWRMFRYMSTLIPALIGFVVFILRTSSNSSLGNNHLVYGSDLKALFIWAPLQIWQRFDFRLDSVLGALCWAILAAGVVFLGLRARRQRRLNDGILLAMIAVGAILFVALPDALSEGWGHMKFRMAHLIALICLPALLSLPRHRGLWLGVALMASVWSIGAWTSMTGFREFDRQAQEFMTMAEEVPRGAVLLTADVTDARSLRPFLHIWSYLCLERDCLSPHIFATRYIQTLYFTDRPAVPPEGETAPKDWQAFADLANQAPYDGVLLSGRSEPGEQVLDELMQRVDETAVGVLYLRRPEAAPSAPTAAAVAGAAGEPATPETATARPATGNPQ